MHTAPNESSWGSIVFASPWVRGPSRTVKVLPPLDRFAAFFLSLELEAAAVLAMAALRFSAMFFTKARDALHLLS